MRNARRALWDDLCSAIRSVVRKPLESLPIILSLGLGIGLNASLFSLLDTLFLAPPPGIALPEELVVISSQTGQVPRPLPVSYPEYLDLSRQSSSLSLAAAFRPVTVAVAANAGVDLVGADLVSEEFFEVLGVRASRGRTFAAGEHGLDSAAVVSERFWRERLAGDPSRVGKKILLNGRPFTVIGVAGDGFRGLRSSSSTQVWLHASALPSVCDCSLSQLGDRRDQSFRLIGRLRPGSRLESFASELGVVSRRLAAEYPETNRGRALKAESLGGRPAALAGPLKIGALLLATLLLLLFLVCANVASALLARVVARRRDLAVALCLGASRLRICRQWILEGLCLCLLGGLAGLLLSVWSKDLLLKLKLPFLDASGIDLPLNARLVGFVLVLALLSALVVVIVPVLQIARADLMGPLRGEEQPRRWGGRRLSPMHLLVLVQVAVCTLSLAAAGLLLESLRSAWNADLGFRTQDLLTASFDVRPLGISDAGGRTIHQEIVARVSGLPGVRSVALAERPPLGGFREWLKVVSTAGDEGILIGTLGVGTGYFETLGLEVRRGRGFSVIDREGGEPVVVINEAFARQILPGVDPVGRLLSIEDHSEEARIVGVVENARFLSVDEPIQPFFYRPLSQVYRSEISLIARTAGPPEGLAEAIRRSVGEVDPRIPVTGLRTVSDLVNRSLAPTLAVVSLLSLVGLIALLLAMLGVYGVTDYMMLRRFREIGIRMALGAHRTSVLASLSLDGLLTVGAGVLIGCAAALASRGWLVAVTRRVDDQSTSVFWIVAGLLMCVGFTSCCIPAVRILKKGPSAVLRF